jgi:hypothetical protein
VTQWTVPPFSGSSGSKDCKSHGKIFVTHFRTSDELFRGEQ